MLTETDYTLCSARINTVDHERAASLQYLGNYVRRLPVNMARMMENALDWAHLPHVHSSSFSTIELVDEGRWGWRAKAKPNNDSDDYQLLELLVDHDKNYWATAVLAGPAAHVEIHTQASTLPDGDIEVDVRFYSSIELEKDAVEFYADVLQQQYAVLYHEDSVLMSGRQSSLQDSVTWAAHEQRQVLQKVLVGETALLSKSEPLIVETAIGRYCVRRFQERWIVHSAVCSHLLGPLDDSVVTAEGVVTCPWHGYRFNVHTGENVEGKCRTLATAPALMEIEGRLYLDLATSKPG